MSSWKFLTSDGSSPESSQVPISQRTSSDADKPTNRVLSEIAIPEFVSSRVDFRSNHKCSRLNRIQCDNSQNFIAQCSRSIHSNCNMNDIILDCRKTTSSKFYKRRVGIENFRLSSFGHESKCIRIKGRRRRKSAICARVKCDPTSKFYVIYFASSFSNSCFWSNSILGERFVICKHKKQKFRVKKVTIYCSDPGVMCGMPQLRCPGNCSGRGKCMLNGRCWCDPFFSGSQCQNFDGCGDLPSQLCLDILSNNGYFT